MTKWRTALIVAGLLTAGPADADPISFRRDVAPLLQERCVGCHSGARPKGGLDLSERAKLLAGGANGDVIVSGKPDDSKLIRMLVEKKMPPKNPLTADEMAILRRWIEEGANWEGEALRGTSPDVAKRAGSDWWSLQPIRRPPVPIPIDRSWADNPIDAFVKIELERKKLLPNPEADRRTFIRRVTLDLTGLRPSPDEVDAFVRDGSADADERLVDRLLASPAYGERWARHWLDVVRFAESHGYEMNTLRTNAWPYRDWVIRAFNSDLPFDRFVREQLAGDTIAGADALTQAATGFLVGGPHDLVGNETEDGKRQQRSDDLFDMVSTAATAFLGLTAGFARCHDHKFDPITSGDFYGLEAIFAGVDHAERPLGVEDAAGRAKRLASARARLADIDRRLDNSQPLAAPAAETASRVIRPPVNARRNVERFPAIEARFVRMTIAATGDGSQPCIDELEIFAGDSSRKNLATADGAKATASSELPNFAIHKIAHLNDGQYGNGRSWISNEPGKGWAQIELPKLARIERIVWGRDRDQKFRDRLATDYRFDVSTDGESWVTVAGSWDRGADYAPSAELKSLTAERDELQARIGALEKPATAYIGAFRKSDVTYLLKRGDVMQRGKVVAPSAIRGIGPELSLPSDSSGPERRQALAGWIVANANPLPARVMVNRVWQYHFGNGLVRTPSDFGFNGDRPSHPELLDFLADEFRANGGHLKPLHRLIVLSRTYRQSSRIESAKIAVDAENRFLWRFTARRIEAEAIRDTILQSTGSLNRMAGGPGYDLWTYANYVTVFTPRTNLGTGEFRRMIYQFKPRTQQDGTFGVFDCPDATGVVPRRNSSTTALQALNLLNGEFMHDQADRFAARIKATESSESAQISGAFRHAFQREPTEREHEAAIRLLRDAGLPHLCRMLLNANEFVTVE